MSGSGRAGGDAGLFGGGGVACAVIASRIVSRATGRLSPWGEIVILTAAVISRAWKSSAAMAVRGHGAPMVVDASRVSNSARLRQEALLVSTCSWSHRVGVITER